MKIGEVARRTGISVETIRYYERLSLLPEAPRTKSGYRAFDATVFPRLRFIRRAQELGFSLEQIRELLALRSTPSSPADRVRRMAEAKLSEVEEKLADLERLRRALREVSRSCTGEGNVRECPILESLEARPGAVEGGGEAKSFRT